MSTSLKPDPVLDRAGHLGPAFDDTIASCRATVDADPQLTYLAHYSSGVYDFGIDRLGEPPAAPDALPTGRRAALSRFGRAFSFTVNRLDRVLQEVRTGGLIRAVVHTTRGAAFCNSVVPKENVVGLVLDRKPANGLLRMSALRPTDQAMAALATTLRKRVRLNSLNPGGWESAEYPAALSEHASTQPHVTFPAPADAPDLTGVLSPADLHLVAYCPDGEVAYLADVLEDPALGPFFTQITTTARRKFYCDFSHELGPLAVSLGRSARDVLGGSLLRMVLDVEQGAVYYYRVRAGTYLVGVTVDQSRVAVADDRMAALVESLRGQ